MLKEVEGRLQSSLEDRFQRLETMIVTMSGVKRDYGETLVKSPEFYHVSSREHRTSAGQSPSQSFRLNH